MLDFGLARGVDRGAGQQRRVLERAVVLVDPQLVGLAVVGDVDVDPAVAVEVGGRDAERRPERAADQGAAGDVGERAVALVVIEPARLRAVAAGRTVVALAGDARSNGRPPRRCSADSCRRTDRASRRGRSRGTPPRRSSRRDSPCAVSIETSVNVPSQLLRSITLPLEAGQVEVDAAVVVEIAGRHAHAVATGG